MKAIFVLLVAASGAFGTAITSAGSGNWNSTGTWTGAAIPGNGDTITIGAGHTVTIPAGYHAIVGASGAGGVQQSGGGPVPAIQCAAENGNGILVLNGTLTFRGNVEQCTAVWTVGPDAILEHDSSLASSPSGTHYRWIIGTYLWPDAAQLVLRGTSGHRALIRNATSSGTFYGFTYNRYSNQGSGQFDFQYATIDGCGGGTPCTDATAHNTYTAFIARCDHCLVTNSGYIGAGTTDPAGAVNVITVTNSTFTSSADGNLYVLKLVPATLATVTLDTIYTTGSIYFPAPNGESLTNTTLHNIVLVGDGTSSNYPMVLAGFHFQVASIDLLLRITDSTSAGASTGTPAYIPGGTLTRLMCLMNSNSNPHCFSMAGDGTHADSITGGYIEKIGTGSDGDLFLGGPIGATTTTLQRVVSTCSTTDGLSIGTFSNVTGSSTGNIAGAQNTICGHDGGNATGMGFSLEVWAGASGLFSSIKDNLVYAASNTTTYLVRQGPTLGGPPDPVAGTFNGVDYNWKWNVSTGPYYGISADYTSPSPPGTHDSSGDPLFMGQRHFLDWAQMLDPTVTTWADVVSRFSHMNDDSGYDARFTLQSAYNWLRDGYRPRNASVLTAGHTGGQAGAMPAPSLFPMPGAVGWQH